MNPPERFAPDDPREWLNRARSNLALAEKPALGMLAAGDYVKTVVGMNPGAAPNDIRACRLPAPGSTGSPAEHLP